MSNVAELVELGRALFSYQHGEYSDAAISLSSVPLPATSTEVALFQANRLLFDGKYNDAISAYKIVIQMSVSTSVTAHNNLGTVIYDQGLSLLRPSDQFQGLSEFSQSIQLAYDIGDINVLSLPLISNFTSHNKRAKSILQLLS